MSFQKRLEFLNQHEKLIDCIDLNIKEKNLCFL